MNKYLESILIYIGSTALLYGELSLITFLRYRSTGQFPDNHLMILDVSMKCAAFLAFYNLLRRILLSDDEVNTNEN